MNSDNYWRFKRLFYGTATEVFYRAGYTNIVNQQNNGANYSYVYRHQSGSLDHILIAPSLRQFAVQSGRWHINADESRSLDYNLEYKSEKQQTSWFLPILIARLIDDPVWLDLRF